MNQVIARLHARKSTRAFEPRDISEADRRAILEAACQAPSAGNQQLYTILDIRDQAIKDRLAVSCDDQPFIARAPMVLIFVADVRKWYDAFAEAGATPRDPGAGDLMLAVTDAAIAAQNAVVAADSLGVGSCYIGDIMEKCEEHRALLNLPDYAFPAVMLVLGYPTPAAEARKKPARRDLKHIVHIDRYRAMGPAELREMLAGDAGQRGYDEWCRAFCQRKYNSDFAREMSRS
ncbi:MAG: nitroreductase, partial [Clostridiales bacterium]|nr:nitroreductase [Clostridiales bacterium]